MLTTPTLAVIIAFIVLGARAAEPVAMVRGVVRDEGGKPLAEVKVQPCGTEHLENGTWARQLTTGIWPSFATGEDGRFTIPGGGPKDAYDLYFDKPGFAPVFLYRFRGSSNELTVVMKHGLALVGRVMRRVGEKLEPVLGATVELCLPHDDLWYQQRTTTDPEGVYHFQVTPPPKGRRWQVVYAGGRVQVQVEENEPVVGPDFEITVKVKGTRE